MEKYSVELVYHGSEQCINSLQDAIEWAQEMLEDGAVDSIDELLDEMLVFSHEDVPASANVVYDIVKAIKEANL